RIILDNDGANGAGTAQLTLTDKQLAQLVADGVDISVEGGIFNTSAHINVIVTQDLDVTTGTWATWLSTLPASVDLKFEINDGATLKITSEQLHAKVAPEGVSLADDGTDQVSGKVHITGAGLNFDPFNSADDVRTIIDGREYVGGSLNTADFTKPNSNLNDGVQQGEWGYNVLIDRTLNGYNRPADVPTFSRLTIDTDAQGGVVGPFSTLETFLRITGEADLTFVPGKGGVDEWGRPLPTGSSIKLGMDDGVATNPFMVDFSSATGAINNLTLGNFEKVAAIYGNGDENAPARVNVEISNGGSVGTAQAGLISSGVQTFVVTDIGGANGEAFFYTCA
ncbi:MAG: hypothetical protein ACN6NT_06800, partial [Comamonas sp.]